MARVLVAMSGGVDSSVAAHLLLEQGHECVGATMLLHGTTAGTARDVEDAQTVARLLGIEHHVFDLSAAFEQLVVQPFADAYEAGRTPSPCVGCNRTVKFGLLLDRARELGCDYLATGHYARVEHASGAPGRHRLLRAADPAKDQSYMLCLLTQEQLGRTLLPLGGLRKTEVRALAARLDLPTARKSDSQDICFIPDGDYRAFLERRRGASFEPGDVLTLDGRPVGRHGGAAGYTIGQRKGLGVALRKPAYVVAKDMAANTVTLGPAEALLAPSCLVEKWNWIAEPTRTPLRVTAKTHYRHRGAQATLGPHGEASDPDTAGLMRLEFDKPQRAMTPGQFAVAYDGDCVVGGGAIKTAARER